MGHAKNAGTREKCREGGDCLIIARCELGRREAASLPT